MQSVVLKCLKKYGQLLDSVIAAGTETEAGGGDGGGWVIEIQLMEAVSTFLQLTGPQGRRPPVLCTNPAAVDT
jgi:hypothetical protein